MLENKGGGNKCAWVS